MTDDPQPAESDQLDTRTRASLERCVQVRLSPDAMQLDLLLGPGAKQIALQTKITWVQSRAQEAGLDEAVPDALIRRLLQSDKQRQWLPFMSGRQATLPVHASLDVLVPSTPPLGRDRFHMRIAVKRGQLLIRMHPGRDGVAGKDLRGREIPGLPSKSVHVPAGLHTVRQSDEQGDVIVADCDGMVYFDHLTFNVAPMRVTRLAELAHGGPLHTTESVFVTDGVPSGASIVADGDIVIAGDVEESIVVSKHGSITVLGCITGHHKRHGVVEAEGDVMVASILHVDVTSKQDIYVQTQARNATLTAGRHLILMTRIRNALYDVDLEVEGALVPLDNPGAPADIQADERRTFNVTVDLAGQAGLSDGAQIFFHPCFIIELSVASAQLKIVDSPPLAANKLVYLKFSIPGQPPIHLLARSQAPTPSGLSVVMFRQMSHQEELIITGFCLAELRAKAETAAILESLQRD